MSISYLPLRCADPGRLLSVGPFTLWPLKLLHAAFRGAPLLLGALLFAGAPILLRHLLLLRLRERGAPQRWRKEKATRGPLSIGGASGCSCMNASQGRQKGPLRAPEGPQSYLLLLLSAVAAAVYSSNSCCCLLQHPRSK